LNFYITGPAGAPGPQGPRGRPGATGKSGSSWGAPAQQNSGENLYG